MIDITAKTSSLRVAVAQAIVRVGSESTITAIKNGTVPKGNVLEAARVAGLFAVKRTSDMIPDCHPLPVESTEIIFELEPQAVIIKVKVATVYKTGVEVEAMHGASVVALTMYDMLKPIDQKVQIEAIKLLEKHGGKSSRQQTTDSAISAAIVVISDSVSKGLSADLSAEKITSKLDQYNCAVNAVKIVPDDVVLIQGVITKLCEDDVKLIITTGGTGVSPRDVTPEAVADLLTLEIPGVMEVVRRYSQDRTPYSMLSRGIAGFFNDTLIVTLPGSPTGVEDYMRVLFPDILHVFNVRRGERHAPF